MSTSTIHPSVPMPAPEPAHAPSDGHMLGSLSAAALWVLAWLAVQLHAALGWALPLLPGSR